MSEVVLETAAGRLVSGTASFQSRGPGRRPPSSKYNPGMPTRTLFAYQGGAFFLLAGYLSVLKLSCYRRKGSKRLSCTALTQPRESV